MFLISDATPKELGFRAIKRWCSTNLFIDKTQGEPCIDAMEPDQILILDDQLNASATEDWIKQLKKQAHSRQILFSFVRLQP